MTLEDSIGDPCWQTIIMSTSTSASSATTTTSALVSEAILSTLSIEQGGDNFTRFLEKITFHILYSLLQRTASHARIAHRAKINVFDVTRAMLSVNYSLNELKSFLLWSKQRQQNSKVIESFPYGQECQVNLEFSSNTASSSMTSTTKPASLPIIPELLPPIPPAYTYKYTPVIGLWKAMPLFTLSPLDLW